MPCGGGLDEGVGGSLKVLFPWRGRRRQSTLAMMAARLPPVESTATEQTDILELTHEEQENRTCNPLVTPPGITEGEVVKGAVKVVVVKGAGSLPTHLLQ